MGLRPMLYAVETGPDRCGGSGCMQGADAHRHPAIWWLALPVLRVVAVGIPRPSRLALPVPSWSAMPRRSAPWFANIDRQMYFLRDGDGTVPW